ncbi:MAG: ferrous iron transport protein A [Candidatus Odinarchaeota archaeon]|nr:ferrous iron transport protein A [Candidatus Odinarchaeota archaeon]
MLKKLSELKVGETGKVVKIQGDVSLKRKLLDMGITSRTKIKVVRTAPLKDPIDFEVKGYQLSLRRIEAENVIVELEDE